MAVVISLLPELFYGVPADQGGDIPRDDGWHFSPWVPGDEDYYLVCHYGSKLTLIRHVRRGATVCLFGQRKGEAAVLCH